MATSHREVDYAIKTIDSLCVTDTVVVWDIVMEESLWLFKKSETGFYQCPHHNTLQISEEATRNQQTAIVNCL